MRIAGNLAKLSATSVPSAADRPLNSCDLRSRPDDVAGGAPVDHEAAPIAILGVPFDNLTTTQTIAHIEAMVASRRPHYLVTPNIDFLVQAMRDVELRRILFEAHLVLCDGTPLLWASRLLGNPLAERVAGSDLVPLLIQTGARRGYRLFFLGGSPETTLAAVRRLQTQHPGLIIAGHYSPPFSDLLEMDHEEIQRRIAQAQPDLLFVCFGCPKQEKWIAMHYRSLGVPVAIGVGGTIDFLAGRLARAPVWMRKAGLEWTFRLIQEPRRLLGRYARDIWRFAWAITAQWIRLELKIPRHSRTTANPQCFVEEDWRRISPPEWLDRPAIEEYSASWENLLATHRFCLFDLSPVRSIDSTGVAFLIRIQKCARTTGRVLVFLAPSLPVRKALHQLQLGDFFDFATDTEAARIFRVNPQDRAAAVVRTGRGSTKLQLAWQSEVTAANAARVWEITLGYILGQALWQRELAIDLASLRFIDSTGACLMVRAKRIAVQENVRLTFQNIQPDVRNVLSLCRLEGYLLDE